MVYIIIGLIIIILIYILVVYNSIIQTDNIVKEAFSTMDVYLKKRWDLIPNLVETVKSYANYESETLTEVTQLRNTNYDDLSYQEKLKTSQKVNSCISKLMILTENYPELKANENFLKLSQQLTEIENDIANSRKYYNGCVRIYNNKVETFPNSLIAHMFGFTSQKWFEADALERENIKVEL
jgi:LemA protein